MKSITLWKIGFFTMLGLVIGFIVLMPFEREDASAMSITPTSTPEGQIDCNPNPPPIPNSVTALVYSHNELYQPAVSLDDEDTFMVVRVMVGAGEKIDLNSFTVNATSDHCIDGEHNYNFSVIADANSSAPSFKEFKVGKIAMGEYLMLVNIKKNGVVKGRTIVHKGAPNHPIN